MRVQGEARGGSGLAMASAPVCPSGGTYAWGSAVPAVGVPYGNCNYAPVGGVTHVLVTTAGPTCDTTDW